MLEEIVKVKKRITIITALLIIAANGATQYNFGQSKSDLYKTISQSQREILRTRINEFVEYHRSKQWKNVYDMFAEQFKKAIEGGLTKEEFLKKKLYIQLKSFTPKSVQKMDENWWIVSGCANFKRGGKLNASVEAYFENDKWYFSDITSVSPCIDCVPKSCKN